MTNDLISRQAAITLPIMPKEYRRPKPMDCDDAYEQGWSDCQSCIGRLPTVDLSEYCDKLWKTAYERGKAETRVIIKLTEEDKESLKKAMNEAELTLMPAEIIHCKDCRWWGISNTCGHWDGMVTAPANGFCSYGERKSDG